MPRKGTKNSPIYSVGTSRHHGRSPLRLTTPTPACPTWELTWDAGAQIDAVWIQDWVGKRQTKYGSRLNWTWQLDTIQYPAFKNFKEELTKKNIKLLGYVNPFFAEMLFQFLRKMKCCIIASKMGSILPSKGGGV